MSESPTEITAYGALLEASGDDPLVAHEVGPALLGPALRLGSAVAFLRENQMGTIGTVLLGEARDAGLLLDRLVAHDTYRAVRSITVPQRLRPVLETGGVRGLGEWVLMSVRPGEVTSGAQPEAGLPVGEVAPAEAHAVVAAHHTLKWLHPNPLGEQWVGARDVAGNLVGVGLASLTPAGTTRLGSITVDPTHRGRGVGSLITRALVDVGLARSPVVVLGVDGDNATALRTYERIGFRTDHVLTSGIRV